MKSGTKGNILMGLGSLALIALCFVGFILGAILWPYSIETWGNYFGKHLEIAWYVGGVLGMLPVFGQASVPIAIITWIAMMFIG